MTFDNTLSGLVTATKYFICQVATLHGDRAYIPLVFIKKHLGILTIQSYIIFCFDDSILFCWVQTLIIGFPDDHGIMSTLWVRGQHPHIPVKLYTMIGSDMGCIFNIGATVLALDNFIMHGTIVRYHLLLSYPTKAMPIRLIGLDNSGR